MLYVNSGRGRVPLISLMAILAISLTVNLPGLAISPIMGRLDQVFPSASHLEIQLLSVLPNFIIIPFILWSGKLSLRVKQWVILAVGLSIYAAAGILYLFADSMLHLILLGCLLGVGCGLVVPIAGGLIGEHFTGEARVKQLGMKSGLSNFMVIVGTMFVGMVAGHDWHYAFFIYLVPLIPLVLIPFLRGSYIQAHTIDAVASETPATTAQSTLKPAHVQPSTHEVVVKLAGIIALYAIATYAIQVVSYYTPFTMQHYHLSTGDVGVATAMFYLSATLAGFGLPLFIRLFGRGTNFWAIALCVLGLYGCGVLHTYWAFILFTFVMGLGYGIIQPIIYDKATSLAPDAKKSTQYFSYVLTANYVAIALTPFIVSGLADLFNAHGVNFSFWLNGSIMAAVLVWCALRLKSFTFMPKA